MSIRVHAEAHIFVELVGLPQTQSCIFFFNSREIGRIMGQDSSQEVEIPVNALRSRERPFNRPWYKEDIQVDIYDSEGAKKSTYKSLLSSKILSKSPQDLIRDNSNKIGELRLPIRDALCNARSLEEGSSGDEKEKGNGNGNGSGNGNGNGEEGNGGAAEAWETYDGVGRWYRIVEGSSNGAPTTSKSKKKATDEEDSDFHETESVYMLVNMLYVNPAARDSGATSASTSSSASASDSDRSNHNSFNGRVKSAGEEGASSVMGALANMDGSKPTTTTTTSEGSRKGRAYEKTAEYVEHKRLMRTVRRDGVLTLRELLPPSNPYFRHLYLNLNSANESAAAAAAADADPRTCLPLPGPSHGEKVVDCRDGVEWRVSAGVSVFGDPIYVLCKGKLVITDLRVLFVPYYLNSSCWSSGAAFIPQVGGYHASVGIGSGGKTGKPVCPVAEVDAECLKSLCRHTYQLYHSALFDCRCTPTPVVGLDTGSAYGNNSSRASAAAAAAANGDDKRASNSFVGGGGDDIGGGGGGHMMGVGAFLECCHEEYTNLMTYGSIHGMTAKALSLSPSASAADLCFAAQEQQEQHSREKESPLPKRSSARYSADASSNGTTMATTYMERLKNSYNIIFESCDGGVVEFTVPKLQKEAQQTTSRRQSLSNKLARAQVESSNGATGDLSSGSDSDCGEESGDESALNIDVAFDNDNTSSSAAGSIATDSSRPRTTSTTTPSSSGSSPRARTSSATEIRSRANDRWSLRQYQCGLSTISITPQIWCHRVCDECIWLARSDCSWILWAKYLKVSAEAYIRAGGRAFDQGWLQKARQPLNVDSDYQRMRVLEAGWRMYDGNSSYEESPSYPQILYVPEEVSDDLVYSCMGQRSSRRLQALVWIHPVNKTPMARCSQPLAGMNYSKLEADIKMIQAIKRCSLSYLFADPSQRSRAAASSSSSLLGTLSSGMAMVTGNSVQTAIEGGRALRIADARPKINAGANALKGGGTENVSYMGPGVATLHYLDIENIHTMRASLERLKQGLVHTSWGWTDGRGTSVSYSAATTDEQHEEEGMGSGGGGDGGIVLVNESKKMDTDVMSQSAWMVHLSLLLKGAIGVSESLANGHPVMVHCSDGWDRTSQLTSLAQVLMDPYYRTISGFLMLVQKEWCSFGHKFEDRIHQEVNTNARTNSADYLLHAQARSANAVDYLQAQSSPISGGTKHRTTGGSEFFGALSGEPARYGQAQSKQSRELSPVFLQFLDCVWQVQRQYPSSFEFSSQFLVSLVHASHSGLFSTFRENNEKCRFALMRHTAKKECMSHSDLHFSTASLYMAVLLRSSGGDRSTFANALYVPPRARDRRFLYLRPRCAGPHDLELWRHGLSGFVDPYVGMLSDPTAYVMSVEEGQEKLLQPPIAERVENKKFIRDAVESLVEDVLDRCFRTFYSDAKHTNRLLLERMSGLTHAPQTRTHASLSVAGSPMSQGSNSGSVGFPLSPESSPRGTLDETGRLSGHARAGDKSDYAADGAAGSAGDAPSGTGTGTGTGTGMSLDEVKRQLAGKAAVPVKKSSWWG